LQSPATGVSYLRMIALGLTLVVSVAALPPPAAAHEPQRDQQYQQVASTYDEAFCDPSDGGECAEEALIDLMPAPAAILDCESPLIADMIGSCDLPAPPIPLVHLPTLRNGKPGLAAATSSSSSDRLSVVTNASSLDGAMPVANLSLHPAPLTATLLTLYATRTQDTPRSRLDRPPRA
jgi:hypothetical protein